MIEIIEILRQEHENIENLLRVMDQELSVFDRGERPDYEVPNMPPCLIGMESAHMIH